MFEKPGVIVMLSTLSLFALLELLRFFDGEFIENIWRYYNSSVIEPLEFILLFTFPGALYLLIFNQTIQQAWWRWARWVLLVPFATIVLMLPTYQDGGGFISFGGTADLVILWGIVFGVATVVYTLYHRWYRKTGV